MLDTNFFFHVIRCIEIWGNDGTGIGIFHDLLRHLQKYKIKYYHCVSINDPFGLLKKNILSFSFLDDTTFFSMSFQNIRTYSYEKQLRE